MERKSLALQQRSAPECNVLAVQAVDWLVRAWNAATTAQAEVLRPCGLSPSAFNVLTELQAAPESTLEPCQLAERLLVSRPSVTGLIDTLQSKGLVERLPHCEDRRRVLVALTPAGRELLQSTLSRYLHSQQRLFADFAPGELATLVVLLRRIRGAIPGHLRADPGQGPDRAARHGASFTTDEGDEIPNR